ncbi:hypothetical protein LOTGIDRAFT_165822 [Lottia gigantea]|uniref:Uncharacterized protein n=1 Tax=Lottia gigantea TaxID=225164 RepID=V3ZVL2_LOTGI|nr:hypothetical protein LOTGIDRAFT_165822 [Lottia gigantea]ESO88377.1 hypothetical protein LOTGIDRAFT_165822 [Lottia gigantea]
MHAGRFLYSAVLFCVTSLAVFAAGNVRTTKECTKTDGMKDAQIIPDSSITSPTSPSVDVTQIRDGGAVFPTGQHPEIVINLKQPCKIEVEIGSVTVPVYNIGTITVIPIDSNGNEKSSDMVTQFVPENIASVTFPDDVRGAKIKIVLTPSDYSLPITTNGAIEVRGCFVCPV